MNCSKNLAMEDKCKLNVIAKVDNTSRLNVIMIKEKNYWMYSYTSKIMWKFESFIIIMLFIIMFSDKLLQKISINSHRESWWLPNARRPTHSPEPLSRDLFPVSRPICVVFLNAVRTTYRWWCPAYVWYTCLRYTSRRLIRPFPSLLRTHN